MDDSACAPFATLMLGCLKIASANAAAVSQAGGVRTDMKIPSQANRPPTAAVASRETDSSAPHGMVTVKLPAPRTAGGKPLMEVLGLRRSIREFEPKALSTEVISDLLWAACGINRPETGDRTAPCWRHVIVIDLYLAMADGVWIYDPKTNSLLPHLPADIRTKIDLHQDYVGKAPLTLIYVGNHERMRDVDTWERRLYASVDAAFIGQNVYLFCASEGIATVFHQTRDHNQLGRTLQVSAEQFVVFAQTVGYPA